MKKRIARSACMLAFSTSALACSYHEDSPARVDQLAVSNTSLNVSDEPRMVTSLATLKNASADSVRDVMLEVKYFDANHVLVDTVTQPVDGLFVPASGEVAFRIREVAARAKEAYVSQEMRIISAVAIKPHSKPSTLSVVLEFLASWGPMLLLIGMFVFFIKRASGKGSLQNRTLALVESQNILLEKKLRLLERLAVAAEAKVNAADPQIPS
ncbi:hypothetical protein [Massilia antarctica]|uniref:hypothetical protein n=1 Tax=Massilia antarctica TaxID=2765360 RepID=UPI0006BD1936|nr:hypothetical protein [Massilia sp. H27-R4]MCY0913666.1 hypothetical protein [Massilia sp. H27-R4]CUI06076.1 hypothetical protein BN2497_6929 [Janthinobacterium sp. CG23_2]CUU29862.1 hypothetical protein BN3177_6929 [Janthinobacterium sp. CG23_2]